LLSSQQDSRNNATAMNAKASFNASAARTPCELQIRPILPSDADVLQSTFEKQSELSRYFRFHSGLRRLPDELLYRLTHVDGVDHVALVAFEKCGTALATARRAAQLATRSMLRHHPA
jgi:hypothetical protein